MTNAHYLTIAADLARYAACPRLAVGCVLVDATGSIVAEGYNAPPVGSCNGDCLHDGRCGRATHAEVMACAAIPADAARPLTAYVTHAPCSSCAHVLHAHGVRRVVFASNYRTPSNVYEMLQMEIEHVNV